MIKEYFKKQQAKCEEKVKAMTFVMIQTVEQIKHVQNKETESFNVIIEEYKDTKDLLKSAMAASRVLKAKTMKYFILISLSLNYISLFTHIQFLSMPQTARLVSYVILFMIVDIRVTILWLLIKVFQSQFMKQTVFA